MLKTTQKSKLNYFNNFSSILFLVALVGFASCETKKKEEKNNGKEEYVITGTIKNLHGPVFLKKAENTLLAIDTAYPDEKGKFELRTLAPEPDFYVLSLQDTLGQLLLLDSTHVEISADANNFHKSFIITGSKATNDYIAFNDKISAMAVEQLSIKKNIPRYLKNKNLDSLKVVEVQLKEAQDRAGVFMMHFADSIGPSLAVFHIIAYLSPEKDFEFLLNLSKKMQEQLPASKYTAELKKDLDEMLAMQKKLEDNGLPVGALAPEISLPNPEGKILHLSSFRGKYVLLDFWASWCGPCRAENPNVVQAYEKYRSRGFEIVSVSLDKDKSAWISAIEKDGLKWNHMSDLKFWESSVVPLYKITGIPAAYLLDKEGKVIAKNLRGAELDQKLEEILK